MQFFHSLKITQDDLSGLVYFNREYFIVIVKIREIIVSGHSSISISCCNKHCDRKFYYLYFVKQNIQKQNSQLTITLVIGKGLSSS